ncbi:uncharacterized protein LOC110190038 isoform X1 [Drosophila serrata]|uniref:uncharacterized protein LOC110190038 isoform X1 n=2 Tax=Drosophila serrata TaxID=7274 RepID=UPI000A1D24C7|nr:uncharacterized protein LOC110190038 isoform X1 [Drosophila serrata]
MTSITQAPSQGVEAAIPIWMKLDWSPEIEHDIYKDWGSYYCHRRRENLGMYYYDKALSLAPEDWMTFYHRSINKRKNALTESALKDSLEAKRLLKKLDRDNAPVNLEICNALYEMNKLENSKAELHDNARLFEGNKTKMFDERLILVDANIADACDQSMTHFISENEKLIVQLAEARNNFKIDERPLWKILKEQGECDVLSIPEIKDVILSPLEIARRSRAFDVFNQMFLDRSWIDVIFLKHIQKNTSLLLDQCKNSRYFLRALTTKKYGEVKKFMKMLQARAPMYHLRFQKFTNKKLMDKFREDHLFRIQYQTRRNMISALRNIQHLRKTKNLTKLSSYVEEVMGDYVVKKTNRTMPWKFEFLNEVYNTLALALVDQYQIPKNFRFFDKNALLRLLNFPTERTLDLPTFVFGDRTTHQDTESSDPTMLKSRFIISRYEKRMVFAKYPIEKCYLLHQIACTHLKSNRYDECCFNARKAIHEAKNCNSNIWQFLSTLVIVKANAALHKLEQTREALANAQKIAMKLGNKDLVMYLNACLSCNEEEFVTKKQSLSNTASRRGSMSVRSSVC